MRINGRSWRIRGGVAEVDDVVVQTMNKGQVTKEIEKLKDRISFMKARIVEQNTKLSRFEAEKAELEALLAAMP